MTRVVQNKGGHCKRVYITMPLASRLLPNACIRRTR
jgi:hypothetical protein